MNTNNTDNKNGNNFPWLPVILLILIVLLLSNCAAYGNTYASNAYSNTLGYQYQPSTYSTTYTGYKTTLGSTVTVGNTQVTTVYHQDGRTTQIIGY